MSEVFKGSVGEYTIVGEKDGAKWGVNVQLDEHQRLAVRFAAAPVPTTKPTHFNFRGTSIYGFGVTPTPGCRFDKVNIPLVQKKVAPAHLLKMIEKMDIVSIVAEYIARQFSKEGVNFNAEFSSEPKTIDLVKFCKLVSDGIAGGEAAENIVPIFVIPLDIVNGQPEKEEKVEKPSSGMQAKAPVEAPVIQKSKEELITEYGAMGEHPDFPRALHDDDVAEGYEQETEYWSWVVAKLGE